MANTRIEGDIASVKASRLAYMEDYLDRNFEAGSFLPPSVVSLMAEMTQALSREIAVYLDRKNRVLKIAVGDAVHVSLPEIESRNRGDRPCGVRLLHTHPNGTVHPSEEDIRSLKNLQLDAMVVLGVQASEGRLTGASVSLLSRDGKGRLAQTRTEGPYSARHLDRFDELFEYLVELDRSAVQGLEEVRKDCENAFLVGVIPEQQDATAHPVPLAELSELAKTAGANIVGTLTQRRAVPDSRYYIGSGSAQELAKNVQAKDADLVIFDDELSPSQIRNLEDVVGVRVIDRTALILDIFAGRATSKEGRLQVELAQQKYRLPRLTGKGIAMSRLGGGIGTRGPGETKLESDKRHIYRKIHTLEAQLKEVGQRRELLRKERKKKDLPVIAVVGYTNAGKSTLVNSLCNSDVFVENELFATLDPSVRKMVTNENRDFLLVDTVGFIRKLPHDLVEAFKSTLEEAVYADLLLHVVDVSDPDHEGCIQVVEQILSEIGAGNRPRYLVLNKIDRVEGPLQPLHPDIRKGYGRVMPASAVSGEGLEEIRDEIIHYFTRTLRRYSFLIPYDKGGILARLHKEGTVEQEEYTQEGTYVRGFLPEPTYNEFQYLSVKE